MRGQTVTIRKLLPASCEEVFDAWLDAEGMRRWMCPGPVMSAEVWLEPRVGGRLRVEMIAPEARYVSMGEFRVLDRPWLLQFTWISTRMENEETLVTIELHRHGADCELVLTHERVPVTHPADVLEQGWGHIVAKLEKEVARVRTSRN